MDTREWMILKGALAAIVVRVFFLFFLMARIAVGAVDSSGYPFSLVCPLGTGQYGEYQGQSFFNPVLTIFSDHVTRDWQCWCGSFTRWNQYFVSGVDPWRNLWHYTQEDYTRPHTGDVGVIFGNDSNHQVLFGSVDSNFCSLLKDYNGPGGSQQYGETLYCPQIDVDGNPIWPSNLKIIPVSREGRNFSARVSVGSDKESHGVAWWPEWQTDCIKGTDWWKISHEDGLLVAVPSDISACANVQTDISGRVDVLRRPFPGPGGGYSPRVVDPQQGDRVSFADFSISRLFSSSPDALLQGRDPKLDGLYVVGIEAVFNVAAEIVNYSTVSSDARSIPVRLYVDNGSVSDPVTRVPLGEDIVLKAPSAGGERENALLTKLSMADLLRLVPGSPSELNIGNRVFNLVACIVELGVPDASLENDCSTEMIIELRPFDPALDKPTVEVWADPVLSPLDGYVTVFWRGSFGSTCLSWDISGVSGREGSARVQLTEGKTYVIICYSPAGLVSANLSLKKIAFNLAVSWTIRGGRVDRVARDDGRVVLTAVPEPGYSFQEWGGDGSCAGASDTCVLVMDRDRNVTAAFDLVPVVIEPPSHILGKLKVVVVNPKKGSVQIAASYPSQGRCGAGCLKYFQETEITLTVTPKSGWHVVWQGACKGEQGLSCHRTVGGKLQTVKAVFKKNRK